MNTKEIAKKMIIGISGLALSSLVFSGCGVSGQNQNKPASAQEETIDEENDNTSKEFAAFAENIHKKITMHWPYMDKVWPDYNYDNHNLILFRLTDDGQTKGAWLLNTKEKRQLKESEYEKLMQPQDGGYEQIKFEGKPSISMSATLKSIQKKKSADLFYRTATHEIVHFYYQDKALVSENGDRSQKFPLEITPRLYRQMIYKNLIAAYDDESTQNDSLQKAKYWLEKWKQEFPEEYKSIKSTDIAESTARYGENLSTCVSADSTVKQLYQDAGKDIRRNKVFYSADAESYEIGFVAALLLDRNQPEWKENFYSEQATAEEKLLENVSPASEEMDKDIESKVTSAIEKDNTKVLEKLKDLLRAKEDKSIPYLKIDITQSMSSMGMTGIIKYEGEEITTGYDNHFKVKGKAIDINGENIFEKVDEDGNQFVYLPLYMPYEWKEDILKVNSEKLKVDEVKVTASQEEGRTIYSVKITE